MNFLIKILGPQTAYHLGLHYSPELNPYHLPTIAAPTPEKKAAAPRSDNGFKFAAAAHGKVSATKETTTRPDDTPGTAFVPSPVREWIVAPSDQAEAGKLPFLTEADRIEIQKAKFSLTTAAAIKAHWAKGLPPHEIVVATGRRFGLDTIKKISAAFGRAAKAGEG